MSDISCNRGWKECHTCAIQKVQQLESDLHESRAAREEACRSAGWLQAEVHRLKESRTVCVEQNTNLKMEIEKLNYALTHMTRERDRLVQAISEGPSYFLEYSRMKTEIERLNKVIDTLHSRLKDAPLFPDEDLKVSLEDAQKRIAVQSNVIEILSEQRENYRRLAEDLLNGKA